MLITRGIIFYFLVKVLHFLSFFFTLYKNETKSLDFNKNFFHKHKHLIDIYKVDIKDSYGKKVHLNILLDI